MTGPLTGSTLPREPGAPLRNHDRVPFGQKDVFQPRPVRVCQEGAQCCSCPDAPPSDELVCTARTWSKCTASSTSWPHSAAPYLQTGPSEQSPCMGGFRARTMANRRYNTNHQPTAELPERASSSPCDVMSEGTSLRTTPLPAPSDVGCSSQHDGALDHGTGLFPRQAMAAGYPHGVVDLQPRGVLMCPGLPPLRSRSWLVGGCFSVTHGHVVGCRTASGISSSRHATRRAARPTANKTACGAQAQMWLKPGAAQEDFVG